MRRVLVLLVSGILLGAVAGPASASPAVRVLERPAAAATVLFARMTGATEIPGPGDPDGRGFAVFVVRPAKGTLCYMEFVRNIALPATGSHIHVGASTVAGPIVIPLTSPDLSGRARGCVGADPSLLTAIAQNPGQYYTNVHNATFPAGAIRGQLHAMPFGAP